MVRTRNRSLKRDGVQWTGIDRRSGLEPQPEGQMTELDNCYVSSDKTELRRMPGWREIADIRPRELLAITSIVAGNPTVINTTNPHRMSSECFVLIENNSTDPDINGLQPVTVPAGAGGSNQFTIPIDTSTGTTVNDGEIYAIRAGALHGVKQVDKSIVVVGEMIAGRQNQTIGSAHVEPSPTPADPTTLHLEGPHGRPVGATFPVTIAGSAMAGVNGAHTATSIDRFAYTIPVNTNGIAADHVCNTVLDVWTRLPAAWVKHQLPLAAGTLDTFDWWKPTPYDPYIAGTLVDAHLGYAYRKSSIDIAERKVVAAYPGYGCCFEVDIGSHNRNALVDEITTLGLSQAVLDDVTTAPSGVGTINGTYYVAIALFARHSGEIGPISAVSTALVCVNNNILVEWLNPWLHMPELPNLVDMLIFGATVADPLSMLLWDVVPLNGPGVAPNNHTVLGSDIAAAINYRSLVTFEIPRGSKFVKTVRGFTLFGGAHGPVGENNDRDQMSCFGPAGTSELVESHGPIKSLGGITGPSWWSGLRCSNVPGAPNYGLLDELQYYDSVTGRVRWNTREIMTTSAARVLMNVPMQKGFIGVSEQGFPWQASELTIVDLRRGADVEYAASMGDGYVIGTQHELYTLFFGRSPSGSQPRLLSEQDGAVAPMVEHDFGVATTSTRGPINISGSGPPEWIGERVEDWFAGALVDSTGFMRYAVVGYDRARELVFFGYRSDLFATDFATAPTDDEKSKVGCDWFLVWSVKSNAWSTWLVPEHLGWIDWMGELLFDDGRARMCFLSGPPGISKLYVFDDDYFDTYAEADLPVFNVNGNDLDNSLVPGKGYRVSVIGSPANYAKLKPGMEVYAIAVSGGTEGDLRGRARFNELEDTAVAVIKILYLDAPINQKLDDRLYGGTITMRLRQKTFPAPDFDGQSVIESVQARHTIESSVSRDVHMRVTLDEVDGVDEVQLTPQKLGRIRTRVETGSRYGEEHEVQMELVGRAYVALKDVVFEEGPGR